MQHREFQVGFEFWCGERRFRCTDVGSRVIVAIRTDSAEISTSKNGQIETRSLDGADAEAQGWFRGPPYSVAECVFDENDLEACSLYGVG